MDNHGVFSLEQGKRGETGMVQFEIDTCAATPKKQHPRRMLFAVREEVSDRKISHQLQSSSFIIIPMCGVPECLPSDRATNLLSYLMKEPSSLLFGHDCHYPIEAVFLPAE